MYKHSLVQELAWVLHSPPLLSGPPCAADAWLEQALAHSEAWLLELDANPEPLRQWIGELSSHRLGKRFEGLLYFWLHHHPAFTVHGTGLQVTEGGKTLGEVDAVFTDDATGAAYHWEAAVKYYLATERDGVHEWIGPNGNDTLAQSSTS